MATPQVQQPSESHKHKTWVLKVSINCPCEGCKKKVKKILQGVEGVSRVDVDAKQQKVTVTGNVGADALIKKLTKSGRHAQLWPQNADQNDKKSNNKVKQSDPQTNKENQKAVKSEAVSAEPAKITQGSTKINETAGMNAGGGEGLKEKEPEAKKPETESAGNQSPPPPPDIKDEKSNDSVVAAVGGEKKKKKGHNGKFAEGEPSSGAAAASTGSINHNPAPPPVSAPANQSPPRHQAYQHPQPPHYYPPPPAYTVSYNTAPPSSSYTASYYAAPPPNAHAYSYPSRETAPPASYIDSYPRQPLDSFEILSDENPNGCSIM